LGDDVFVGPTKDVLEVCFGSELHLVRDLLVSGIIVESNSEINNGYVCGWDSESHTCELTVKLWDNLTNSLGSSCG
jgi:hypothetical protein